MVKNSLFFFILTFIVVSCGENRFDTSEQILEFLANEENEYTYSKVVNGVSYQLTYKPTDLLVKQELGENFNQKLIDDLRLKYKRFIYFDLSMSINDQELLNNVAYDKNRFGQIVNELAFGMEDKINLYTPKNDTLSMTDFIYPRLYGMSRSTSIMVVYPRDNSCLNEEYLYFTVEDLGFDTGEIRFKVKTKSILNEPHLRFN